MINHIFAHFNIFNDKAIIVIIGLYNFINIFL